MFSRPDTYPIDLPPLASVLSMPYTLTPGKATGTFLAEIGRRRIVGSQFKGSGRVVVPAQDFCPDTGDAEYAFIEAPATGVLTDYTETAEGIIGLIRIDGSGVGFPHRILEATLASLSAGLRVEVVWADEVQESVLAIAGFRPVRSRGPQRVRATPRSTKPTARRC